MGLSDEYLYRPSVFNSHKLGSRRTGRTKEHTIAQTLLALFLESFRESPDARREASPPPIPSNGQGAVARDDVRDVTRAIEGLSRKLDDLRREYERRGRY